MPVGKGVGGHVEKGWRVNSINHGQDGKGDRRSNPRRLKNESLLAQMTEFIFTTRKDLNQN